MLVQHPKIRPPHANPSLKNEQSLPPHQCRRYLLCSRIPDCIDPLGLRAKLAFLRTYLNRVYAQIPIQYWLVGVYISSRRVCDEYMPDWTGVGLEIFPCSGDCKSFFTLKHLEMGKVGKLIICVDIFCSGCSALDSGLVAYGNGCCGG